MNFPGMISNSLRPAFLVGVSPQGYGNAISATATLGFTPHNKEIVLAHAVATNGADGASMGLSSGQGWMQIASVEETNGINSLSTLWWKRWGDGATDSLSVTATGSSGTAALVLSVVGGAKRTGTPYTVGEVATAHGSVTPPVQAASSTIAGPVRSLFCFFHAQGTVLQFSDFLSSESAYTVQSPFLTGYKGAAYAQTAGPDMCMGLTWNLNVFTGGSPNAQAVTNTPANLGAWTAITLGLDPS